MNEEVFFFKELLFIYMKSNYRERGKREGETFCSWIHAPNDHVGWDCDMQEEGASSESPMSLAGPRYSGHLYLLFQVCDGGA